MISEGNTDKLPFTHRALKIKGFTNKNALEKRKLLAKDLDTIVDDMFPDSLDEVRSMYLSDQTNNKSGVPVIPRVNKNRKLEGESYEVVAPKVVTSTKETTIEKLQEGE